MRPSEKAKELTDKYMNADYTDISIHGAKQCALICVDEIQEHAQMIETEYEGYNNAYQYFLQVKLEISLL